MNTPPLHQRYADWFGSPPAALASAPGRLEVLGNHTDYNLGLTLSCAVAFRCHAAVGPLDSNELRLASTAFDTPPETFPLDTPLAYAPRGHWANYILGLVAALRERGIDVPGFALAVDSAVPRSAGVSSSAALEMAVLTALLHWLDLDLPTVERARVGQWAESRAVGAQTGLLDQLTSLCGRRDHLLRTDFRDTTTRALPVPPGYALVAVDSGVKHDLTVEYNDRRAACERAAEALGVDSLREATLPQLDAARDTLDDDAYHCAKHILGENRRVTDADAALDAGDIATLGRLMFDSHTSSRDHFRNSCPELDALVAFAHDDPRCLGARLSGGGFGGISIHLVPADQADTYRHDLHRSLDPGGARWSAVCTIDDGARVEA